MSTLVPLSPRRVRSSRFSLPSTRPPVSLYHPTSRACFNHVPSFLRCLLARASRANKCRCRSVSLCRGSDHLLLHLAPSPTCPGYPSALFIWRRCVYARCYCILIYREQWTRLLVRVKSKAWSRRTVNSVPHFERVVGNLIIFKVCLVHVGSLVRLLSKINIVNIVRGTYFRLYCIALGPLIASHSEGRQRRGFELSAEEMHPDHMKNLCRS